MSLRTDLAAERILLPENKDIEGVHTEKQTEDELQLEITRVKITSENAAEKLGKPCGNYFTVRFLTAVEDFSPCFEQRVKFISGLIKQLAGNCSRVLMAGIGNAKITPDALGVLFAEKIFPTLHIKKHAHEIFSKDMGEISVIKTDVMGQTGIESSEIVKAVCRKVNPEIVLAADALACSDTANLGNTIQLCDTGISPGSGVANARKELSIKTLGIKCIAMGIPTVADLDTLAPGQKSGMMVTPRNIDKIVQNGAKYLAYAANLAFLPEFTVEDLESLVE